MDPTTRRALIFQAILTVIGSTVGTFFVGWLINYLGADSGSIVTGGTITVGSQQYAPLDVALRTNDVLDDLILVIPSGTPVAGILASAPIKIEQEPDVAGTSTSKRVRVSGLEPNAITRLLIPVRSEEESRGIRAANAATKHLGSGQNLLLAGAPREAALRAAGGLLGALIVFICYAIFNYVLAMRSATEIADLRRDVDTAREEGRRERALIGQNTADLRRAKLLTLARLSDYAKELQFWRDTVRKAVYQTTNDTAGAEKLIAAISESLGTQSTAKAGVAEFETVKMLAAVLRRAEDGGKAE